jgi:hypothetical protein
MRSISSEISCIASETREESMAPKSVAINAQSPPMAAASHAWCSASPK